MKLVKIVGIIFLVYIGFVAVVEFSLGFFQPEEENTFVITTTDEDGNSTDRVLVRNFSNGQLYASAYHWPRAWYYEALKNPNVQVTIDGVTGRYVAVPVNSDEHERVAADNPHGVGFYLLVGFAPRKFLRLDPQ